MRFQPTPMALKTSSGGFDNFGIEDGAQLGKATSRPVVPA